MAGDEFVAHGGVEQLGPADPPPRFGDPSGHDAVVTVAGDAVWSESDEQVRSDRRDDVGDAADGGFGVD
jgi:hypothetical protein